MVVIFLVTVECVRVFGVLYGSCVALFVYMLVLKCLVFLPSPQGRY